MGGTTRKTSRYLGEWRTREIQPLDCSIDVGKDEQGFRVWFLQPFAQGVVRNHPGNEGRVALHEVGFRLSPLQSFVALRRAQHRGPLRRFHRLFGVIFRHLRKDPVAPALMRGVGLFFTFFDAVSRQMRSGAAKGIQLIKLRGNPSGVRNGD